MNPLVRIRGDLRGRGIGTADNTRRNAIRVALTVGCLSSVFVLAGWWLFEFDRALVTYAWALILSASLTAYRFTIWLHRPPTWMLYRRACVMLQCTPSRMALAKHVLARSLSYFVLNRFVLRRGVLRWAAHWPIMAGCMLAFAIVLPLILGWVWFETVPQDLHSYQVMLFGNHIRTLPVDGWEAFLVFHGLVWASLPVLLGCSVALWRRLRDRGDRATQTFGHDIAPLMALLTITMTGLLMTVSYSFWGGLLHAPLAVSHLIVVCGTLLWLPYSKLFHIPQRTLKLAHIIYEHESSRSAKAVCHRCGDAFAAQLQVEDLIEVERRLGYRYQMEGHDHYQEICPRCRRATLVIAQGKRWHARQMTEVH